jgi:hypothetical protein
MVRWARTNNLINPAALVIYEQLQMLRKLRRQADNDGLEWTVEQATEYVQLVEQFVDLLARYPAEGQNPPLPTRADETDARVPGA